MIYSFSLQMVGFVVGLALLLSHLFAATQAGSSQEWMKLFPRSRAAGTVLIVVATVWSFLLINTMDLGEFASMRTLMLAVIVAGGILAWRYVEEFLAVRALGMLALLSADILLDAAYLRPEPSRLVLVCLAYLWIVLGFFWVGMPWTLRDQIAWVTAKSERFQAMAWTGAAFGAVVLGCSVWLWK